MNLLAFLGIPDCAVHDCPNPGLVKIEIEGENGRVWAHLCISCLGKIGPCFGGLSTAAHEEIPLLGELDSELEPEPGEAP